MNVTVFLKSCRGHTAYACAPTAGTSRWHDRYPGTALSPHGPRQIGSGSPWPGARVLTFHDNVIVFYKASHASLTSSWRGQPPNQGAPFACTQRSSANLSVTSPCHIGIELPVPLPREFRCPSRSRLRVPTAARPSDLHGPRKTGTYTSRPWPVRLAETDLPEY